jgi:predicted small metal-binding protein
MMPKNFSRILYSLLKFQIGQNCDCIVQGETEEELMKNAAEQAVKDHGYTEADIMTPEMKKRTKSHVHKS